MDSGHALVEGLLYGRLENLSPETVFLFSRTGLLHLFSASGFHMGVAVMMAGTAARIFGRYFRSSFPEFFLSLALMIFFGWKTQWSSPMVRAFAFTCFLTGARLLEIRPSSPWVFLLSLLAAALFGRGTFLSFLLSAAGMAGVLLLGGGSLISLALGPWLFTLPLVVCVFHLFSLLSPLWNLTFGIYVAWTVLPLAILDLLLAACGLPWRGALDLSAALMERGTAFLERADSLLGGAYWVKVDRFFVWTLILSLLLLAFRKRPRLSLAACLPIAFVPGLLPSLKLAVLDVGQGDAIFLRNPQGGTVLVDGGPSPFAGWPGAVNRALEEQALGPIDHFLLTHGDKDHWGGAPTLFQRHKVRQGIWLRREWLGHPKILPLLESAEQAGLSFHLLENESPPGLRCWLPPPVNANESSPLCLGGLQGGKSVWLTGDGGVRSERWLLAQGKLPRADYLKLGHHGSRSSSSEAFLRATGARLALISAGRRNRYGHPHNEVLERVKRLMPARRTDREGSLLFY